MSHRVCLKKGVETIHSGQKLVLKLISEVLIKRSYFRNDFIGIKEVRQSTGQDQIVHLDNLVPENVHTKIIQLNSMLQNQRKV
jgi:citrate lyase synthetase